jgi:vacuolar protein sorting-associated protein 13A/C
LCNLVVGERISRLFPAAGFVGKLVLKVPWKSLKSRPVEVEISDVVLVVAPENFATFEYDEEKEKANAVKRKLENLDQAEALKQMRDEAAAASKDDRGFAAKLVVFTLACFEY